MLYKTTLKALVLVSATALLSGCNSTENSSVKNADTRSVTDSRAAAPALSVDPAIVFGQLDNGMRYAILENDTPSGSGALRMRFEVGSFHESEDQRGLAHFLEHMAFNGSENVPEGEMVKILERLGLAFGADTNAYTSFDETVYLLDLPNLETETLDAAFFLFRETADKLTVTDGAVDRERGVIRSEERARNTPGFRSSIAQMAFLFPETLMPERLPIGLMEVVDSDTAAQRMRDLYADYYRPENTVLVFVGDANPKLIEARIKETFGDWTETSRPGAEPDIGLVSQRGLEAGFFYDPDVRTSVSISSVKPALNPSDSSEARYQDLLRSLGNDTLSRRLARLADEADAPFFSGQASFSEQYDTADAASISMATTPENWRGALAIAERELRRARTYGFTQGEVREMLANYRAAYEAAADRASTRRSGRLAGALMGSISSDRVFTHPGFDLEWFESMSEDITPEAVSSAFNSQWDETEPLIFLTSSEEIAGAEDQILAAYKGSRQQAVTPPVETQATEFAYADFGAPGVIAEQTDVVDLGISQTVFENGVKLSVKQSDFEEGVVRISVRFGAGQVEMPKDVPGLSVLAENTFISGGLGEHSADELRSLTAGKRISTSFAVAEDAFVLSGTTREEDLGLQLQVLAAYLTDPGFRPEALSRFRQAADTFYDSLDATPGGILQRDGARLLRSGDARFGLPTKDVMLSRDLNELASAMERARSEGGIEIGIVGDLDPASAVELVAESFGALPAREASMPAFDEGRVLQFPEGIETPKPLYHAGNQDRAVVRVAWPTTDDSDVKTYREIALLERVLSNRLIDRVREAEGATYSPSASVYFASAFPGYGNLTVTLDLTPEDTERFFAIVDEIAESLMRQPVSEDELDRARVPLLEDIKTSDESNPYWLDLVSRSQGRPEVLERHRSRAAGYDAVTQNDLLRVAREVFQADRAYRLVVLPEPSE